NALGPLLLQRLALRATDINAGQPASHRVKAGGQQKNGPGLLPGRRLDPVSRHSFDGGGAEINKAHIVLIEDLVKVLFEGRPLDTVRMYWLRRGEHLANGRNLDPRPG